MGKPTLIAADWGTTSCRVALMSSDGTVIDSRNDGCGILAVQDGGFEAALARLVAPWRSASVPIILSGMIGSRQGWQEAPYVRCPAGIDEIAARLTWIETRTLGRLAIVPGLDTHGGGMPDVMRGEETQIFGAMERSSGVAVLPGTHSKWATVEHGRIVSFGSYMTGEVFAALKDHTILGRLMEPRDAVDHAAFTRGVSDGAKAGGPGALLNRVFATRTLGLFGELAASSLADYLSGLLIGAEIADNRSDDATPVMLIGSEGLTSRYAAACQVLGQAATKAPTECAARGAFMIARLAGCLGVDA